MRPSCLGCDFQLSVKTDWTKLFVVVPFFKAAHKSTNSAEFRGFAGCLAFPASCRCVHWNRWLSQLFFEKIGAKLDSDRNRSISSLDLDCTISHAILHPHGIITNIGAQPQSTLLMWISLQHQNCLENQPSWFFNIKQLDVHPPRKGDKSNKFCTFLSWRLTCRMS